MITAVVTHDLTHHVAMSRDIQTGGGAVREVLRSYERVYRGFIIRRFDNFSRGGGDWKKNSPATILAKGSSAILVNTRVMRLGLATAVREIEITRNSVTFQFQNASIHPDARVTIAELLTKHDKGLGTPKRVILVQPDDPTKLRLLDMTTRRYARKMNGAD
jgi:hypothetical protein